MIARLRWFLRNEPTGITLPVGFILLYAMWNLLAAIVGGLMYPFVLHVFHNETVAYRLDFHVGNVRVDATAPFIDGVAFAFIALVVYFVFVRVISADTDVDAGMRECPECKSDIVVEASRCAFCTAAVTPIEYSDAEFTDDGELATKEPPTD